jgi:FixJ family two-component response regulator
MPRIHDIPVVVTTGVPDPDIDARLHHCGASAFLLKPFGPRDLVQAVALALALRPEPAAVEAADQVSLRFCGVSNHCRV